jgi:3-methyladenine DNA glycosylase AlkD/isopentenyldiphosphate isomerase
MGSSDELVEVVDEQDRVTAVITRAEMRASVVRHRSVGILVHSSDGRLLVHKRADDKDLLPGFWDVAAGGVAGAGESYHESAVRELAEEYGISTPLEPLGLARFESSQFQTYIGLYRTVSDGPYRFADGEVAEAVLMSPDEVQAAIADRPFMPDSLAVSRPFLVRESAAATAWADSIVAATVDGFVPLASVEKADWMRPYMKEVAPFLGIASPERKAAQRDAWKPTGRPPDDKALALAVRRLWLMPEREFTYAAIDLLDKFGRKVWSADFLLDHVEQLVRCRPWWDSIDGLVGAAIEPLVRQFPEHKATMRTWSESGDRWLIRAAILHQLHAKDATDEPFLFELCARHGSNKEFFIAKAIGWALRERAYRSPDTVRSFVAATTLQPLSAREALKRIGP